MVHRYIKKLFNVKIKFHQKSRKNILVGFLLLFKIFQFFKISIVISLKLSSQRIRFCSRTNTLTSNTVDKNLNLKEKFNEKIGITNNSLN